MKRIQYGLDTGLRYGYICISPFSYLLFSYGSLMIARSHVNFQTFKNFGANPLNHFEHVSDIYTCYGCYTDQYDSRIDTNGHL